MQEDVGKLYTNTMSFHIRDLSIHNFENKGGPWNQSPKDTEEQRESQARMKVFLVALSRSAFS